MIDHSVKEVYDMENAAAFSLRCKVKESEDEKR